MSVGNVTNQSLFDELDSLESGMFLVEVVIFIPTVFGNILILVSMHKFHWLRTPLNILVENLAVCDLLIALLLIPLDVLGTSFGLNRLRQVCLCQLTILMALLFVSLFTILAISVERYISVAYPWQHRLMKRHRYVNAINTMSWIMSILLSSSPSLGWNNFIDGVSRCHLHQVWPMALRYTVNAVIMLITVTHVVLFAIVVKIGLKRLPNMDQGDECRKIRRHLAKTYVMIAISTMFIICWAPYCIVTFFSQFFFDREDLKIAHGWTLLLGFFNTSLNWLIYGLKNEKMRHAFKLLLCVKPSMAESIEMESR